MDKEIKIAFLQYTDPLVASEVQEALQKRVGDKLGVVFVMVPSSVKMMTKKEIQEMLDQLP